MRWFKSLISNPLGWVNMLWNNILVYFGKRHNPKVIPKGIPYCYLPDMEKNANKADDDSTYYIKPCPYYKSLGDGWNGCKYAGIVTDDMTFDDQCKICGEGDDY